MTEPLSTQECGDIAITAAEGGIGYWSVIERYQPSRWWPDDHEFESDKPTRNGQSASAADPISACRLCGQGSALHPRGPFDNLTVPDDFVFYTIEYENPTGRGTMTSDITPDLLRRGFATLLAAPPDDFGWMIQQLRSISRDDWMGEIDSVAADAIVQTGIFGHVVFS